MRHRARRWTCATGIWVCSPSGGDRPEPHRYVSPAPEGVRHGAGQKKDTVRRGDVVYDKI